MNTKARVVACGLVLSFCGTLQAQEQDQPAIHVVSASYGLNASEHVRGNATK